MGSILPLAVASGGRSDTAPVVGSRLSPAGGIAIAGIDLSQPLMPRHKDRILDAFRDHHVVVFPDQTLTREAQFSFTANFGDIERHGARQAPGKRYDVAHVTANLDHDGNPTDRFASGANYRWHTDKPYYPVPPLLTTLYAVELPPQGGDTQFANTAMAYDALPEETKRRIAGLRVVFRWEPGRHQSNGRSALGDGAADRPPVGHPLVRTHPDTGRKALYLGNHASHILGMPEAEGATLLDTLLRHVTQPRFVYTHRWRTRDLVMWDNRCLLHRAVANYDMNAHRRVMHRNVVRGTVPF